MAEQSNGVPKTWQKKWLLFLADGAYKDRHARILIMARSMLHQ
jgi:hypothetical protein